MKTFCLILSLILTFQGYAGNEQGGFAGIQEDISPSCRIVEMKSLVQAALFAISLYVYPGNLSSAYLYALPKNAECCGSYHVRRNPGS